MYKKEDLKVGYAPTRRNVFSREDAIKYKNLTLHKIRSLGFNVEDIEEVNDDGLLLEEKDIELVVKKFKTAKVDCVFSPHCNFGTENVVAKVAKEIGKPFLLWGPRDEAPRADGFRLRDSQCGLFATSKILSRYNIPFTYIINSRLDDKVFETGFENFTKAANVVKAFSRIRIGQIGTRPEPFWSVIVNEGELLEKFNIEIIPYNLIDVVSIAKEIKKTKDQIYIDTLSYVKSKLDIEIEEEKLENIISLKEAIKRIKQLDNISAFAIQCWPTLGHIYGIVPCLSSSLLFDEDIPIACETDINGAVSAIIAQAATFYQSKVIFADITNRHPYDDNGELLWHCGPFPISLKKNRVKGKVKHNDILDGAPAGTCNFEIKGGNITVVRFDGIKGKYNLFVGEAVGISGAKTTGTYLWIKVNNWAKWEEKLIYGPYIHHIAAVHGKFSPVIQEAVRYIDGLELDSMDSGKEMLI